MRFKNYLILLLFFLSIRISYAQATYNPEVVVGSDSKLSITGDLDGDGKPELLSGSYSNVSVFLNTSSDAQITSGMFSNPLQLSTNNAKAFSIKDIDNDGKSDVIVFYADYYNIGGIKIYKNTSTTGSLSFDTPVEATFTTTQYLTSGIVTDFNNDGILEAAAAGGNSTYVYSINVSSGITLQSVFTLTTNGVTSLAAADIDGDGKEDLIANTGGIKVFRSTGTTPDVTFSAAVNLQTEDGYFAISDIDGDGKPDLATGKKYYKDVFIRKNQSTPGNINFATAIQIATTSSDANVLIEDVNNDTHRDLVVLIKKEVSVYLNKGTGTLTTGDFENPALFYLLQEAKALYSYDVNSDGLIDLLFNEYNFSSTTIMRNTSGLAPVITNISPGGGIEGDQIKITGSGFSSTSSENEVMFGSVKATIVSSTSTEIVATIPNTVTKGITRVYVLKNGIYSAPYNFVTLSEEGLIEWTRMGGNTYVDWVSSLAKDNDGNIIMAGGYYNNNFNMSGQIISGFNGTNALVSKFDPNGNVVFVKSFSGKNTNVAHGESAEDVAVDDNGNIYVTGKFSTDNYISGPTADFGSFSVRSRGQHDMFLTKIDPTGEIVWVKTGGSSLKGASLYVGDLGDAVTIDNEGNVYVTGSFSGTAHFEDQTVTSTSTTRDIYLAKYKPDGSLIWVKSFTGESDEAVFDLIADRNGHLYIGGTFSNSFTLGTATLTTEENNNTDAFFAKLDTAGNSVWVKHISGKAGEGISEISYVASETKVYLTGTYSGTISADGVSMSGGGSYIVGWDATGTIVLSKNINGVTINSIDHNTNGELYITGYFSGAAAFDGMILSVKNEFNQPAQDLFVVKLNNSGEVISLFSPQNNMVSTSTATGSDIVVLADGIAIGGNFSNSYAFKDTIGVSIGAEDIYISRLKDENLLSTVYSVSLTSPVGGEVWFRNETYLIEWTSNGSTNIKLEYSTNAGSTWKTIIASIAASDGSYSWKVPNNIVVSKDGLIKISSVEQPAIFAISNPIEFTKPEPVFKLTYPNGGEHLTVGTNVIITYEVNESTKLNFEYSIDGGTNWETINNWQNVNNGQYSWTVPDANSANCLIRMADSYNNSISDTSNAVFTISSVTSITNGTNETINVFPNPAHNEISIDVVKQGEYVLVDMEGKTILSGKVNGGSIETIITEGIHPGIYSLRIKSDNEVVVTKVIIK